MNLEKYQHKRFTFSPNKLQMKPIEISFDNYEEFNKIYLYVKENYMRVEPTKSKAMPKCRKYKHHDRYMIVESPNKIELTIVCNEGCYRFLIGNKRDEVKNPVSGKESLREVYKIAKKFEIDLSKYALNREEGQDIKKQILSPHIKQYGASKIVYENVHHLDFNSSHWSCLINEKPEVKPIAEYMYSKRKENDAYYKHVLTNSYGTMQSPHCPDINNKGKISPYQFSNLAKIMCNGTYNKVEFYVNKLKESGRRILLTNTDGIWYQGDLYHDENEGKELGQWKNDHQNCTFIMKSKGAYQYIENNICHSVVRGLTLLDRIKPREEWTFGEIFSELAVEEIYMFDYQKGVIKNVKEI